MTTEMNWEIIHEDKQGNKQASAEVQRTSVPGGWLVRQVFLDYLGNLNNVGGITFVPDPKHTWDST